MIEQTLNFQFDEELYKKIEKEYNSGNYSGAIKTALLFLTECIRERTDLDLDGDTLITTAFSLKNPLIKLNNLNSTSEIDEQTGHMMILQGIYKGIRNPRNHNLKSDDRFTCNIILTLINYFVLKIKDAKLYFDYNDFLESINDIHFDKSVEYSNELIKLIPSNKLFDVNISLMDNIDKNNFLNIAYVLISSLNLFEEEDRNKFYSHCSKVLHKTNDTNKIKALVFALKNNWRNLENLACIRIEGLLIKSLENLSFIESESYDEYRNYYTEYIINDDGDLATFLKYIPIPFTKKVPINSIHNLIIKKMYYGAVYIEFIFKHFHSFLFKNDSYLYSIYNDVVVKLLNENVQAMYNKITSGFVSDNEFEPHYNYDDIVHKAIQQFEERNIKLADDDMPF